MNAALTLWEPESFTTTGVMAGEQTIHLPEASTSFVLPERNRRAQQAPAFMRFKYGKKSRPLSIYSERLAGEPAVAEATEAKPDEFAQRQLKDLLQRLAAIAEVAKRLADLKEIAVEEDHSISRESLKALRTFLGATAFTKWPYISLLDNGNLRAFWEDRAAGEQIGLQFLGGDEVQFVIFARRAEEGFVARSAGRDLLTGIHNQIEANDLRRLME